MMRHLATLTLSLLFVSVMLFSTYGCFDKKPQTNDSVAVDSIVAETLAVDTLSSLLEEMPVSKHADELFDDFIFSFAASKKMQFKRIKFPLDVYADGKIEQQLSKKQWEMEYFFMKQGYFTLLFDNANDIDMVKDTAINKVIVEKIFLQENIVKQYRFERIHGKWTLASLENQALNKNENGSFWQFYKHFSTDSVFQVQSMNETVSFTAPDPDDDFGTITGSIIPEQWHSFKPSIIPQGIIYNIRYGQKCTSTTRKVFMVRGIATDLQIEMVFNRKQDAWKLMKFNS